MTMLYKADKMLWNVIYSKFNNISATKYFIEDYSIGRELKKLDTFSDLGVKFDNKLTFWEHMNEKKFKKAYSILGVIKRNFIYV